MFIGYEKIKFSLDFLLKERVAKINRLLLLSHFTPYTHLHRNLHHHLSFTVSDL